jgi:hypothetical protein
VYVRVCVFFVQVALLVALLVARQGVREGAVPVVVVALAARAQ